MIFTETWLLSSVPDAATELTGSSMHWTDRTSGKIRGGGLFIHINKTWSTDSVTLRRHSSANLEFIMVKCRLYYLAREFTSIIVTAFYASQMLMPHLLHATISQQQTAHTEAAFIVADDHTTTQT